MAFLRHERKNFAAFIVLILLSIVWLIIYIYIYMSRRFLSFFPVLDKLDVLDVLDIIFVCAFHRSCCCYTQVTKNK